MVKNFFLISNLNLPHFSLEPSPLVLSLHTLVKRVMLGLGASLSPSTVGTASAHPARLGGRSWEAMGRVAGQGGRGPAPQHPHLSHAPRAQCHLLRPPHVPCQHPWVSWGGCTPPGARVRRGGGSRAAADAQGGQGSVTITQNADVAVPCPPPSPTSGRREGNAPPHFPCWGGCPLGHPGEHMSPQVCSPSFTHHWVHGRSEGTMAWGSPNTRPLRTAPDPPYGRRDTALQRPHSVRPHPSFSSTRFAHNRTAWP